MKKRFLAVMATLLALALSAGLALAEIQPSSTQSGIVNGIYSCCGWGGGYPPYPPPRY